MFLASSFLIFVANRFAMLHVIFHKQLRSRDSNAVASGGGRGGLGPPKKILPSSKSFFLLLSKYFDWKDTKLHANYFLYNEKCCFPSYKSNTVSFISINYKSSFFSLCIEIYLCTPCALFLNCFPKLPELKGVHL